MVVESMGIAVSQHTESSFETPSLWGDHHIPQPGNTPLPRCVTLLSRAGHALARPADLWNLRLHNALKASYLYYTDFRKVLRRHLNTLKKVSVLYENPYQTVFGFLVAPLFTPQKVLP